MIFGAKNDVNGDSPEFTPRRAHLRHFVDKLKKPNGLPYPKLCPVKIEPKTHQNGDFLDQIQHQPAPVTTVLTKDWLKNIETMIFGIKSGAN